MTHRRVVTTRRADEDIHTAVAYYLEVAAPDASLRFIDELENAKDLLAEHPSIGSTRFAAETTISELRGLALRRFPYMVFYTEDPDAIRLHRVLQPGEGTSDTLRRALRLLDHERWLEQFHRDAAILEGEDVHAEQEPW